MNDRAQAVRALIDELRGMTSYLTVHSMYEMALTVNLAADCLAALDAAPAPATQERKMMMTCPNCAAEFERLYPHPAAPADVPQREAWQDIATAPKDGTSVLLGGPGLLHATGFGQVTARYIDHDIEYWHIDDGKFGPWPLRGPAPTHWMPLPAPPTGGAK